ncbi:class I SAM-dependent methyltransferase [Mycobacterium sp. URHB0044]|jgi:ubiquinone/menaquinone biosynthesis C-methylase UbiE|uniref:class I SAM-dependent methyltransferase n=1 Tax=Mycobacterium sp. URHB0044 TaxID=1380386 RepID=UPI00048C65ED|nr:class I SAM-dependent methyltransferase [Mycobacterium sp. URHB0044]
MTKDHPTSVTRSLGNRHDYLPAAGLDFLLPSYDLLTRVLGMRPVYDALVAQAELFDGAKVLEIGCGTGNLTMKAKRAHPGVRLTGFDPDPRALARARRKAGRAAGVQFDQGYAQELPYADGSFDRVLSSMMLHHLDDDVKAAAIAESFRVLRPGGSIHVADVTGHHGAAARNGSVIQGLLRAGGFESAVLGSRRIRLFGPVSYVRGIRPL